MAREVRIEWSAAALADLDRFAEFLQERYPSLARTVAREILAKAKVIAVHPQLGRAVEGRREYREILVRVLNATYALQYAWNGQRLIILRVFHGREKRD